MWVGDDEIVCGMANACEDDVGKTCEEVVSIVKPKSLKSAGTQTVPINAKPKNVRTRCWLTSGLSSRLEDIFRGRRRLSVSPGREKTTVRRKDSRQSEVEDERKRRGRRNGDHSSGRPTAICWARASPPGISTFRSLTWVKSHSFPLPPSKVLQGLAGDNETPGYG